MKCQDQHLRRNNPRSLYRPWAYQLESNLAEKDLRVLVDRKLTPCQAKNLSSILACIKRSFASRLREVTQVGKVGMKDYQTNKTLFSDLHHVHILKFYQRKDFIPMLKISCFIKKIEGEDTAEIQKLGHRISTAYKSLKN